jgi:hypothetical protein
MRCNLPRSEGLRFSVRYDFAEYRSFLLDHMRATEGRLPSYPVRVFLLSYAAMVFAVKRWRMPLCEFRIDQAGIRRSSAAGELDIGWSGVTAIRRYSRGYLVELGQGAIALPYRSLAPSQRERLESLIAARERELEHGAPL